MAGAPWLAAAGDRWALARNQGGENRALFLPWQVLAVTPFLLPLFVRGLVWL